jgi:hypothetical protein
MDEQPRITHHYSSSFFLHVFISIGQRRTPCFILYIVITTAMSVATLPTTYLHPNNFGVTSFHLIHPYPSSSLRHLEWA